MTPLPKIKELIDFLRDNGVLEYEENGIKLSLAPNKPQELTPMPKKVFSPAKDKLFGLTAEEQEDLFNVVVSEPSE